MEVGARAKAIASPVFHLFAFMTLTARRLLISGASPSAVLAWKVNLRMHYPHVASERVGSRKGLVFGAEGAARLLLADVVDGIFVPREIVGP
jgi:hypothetical protein